MANRYWVGGTAAWDGTAGTKWALTSGGAGGQAVPTAADDVFFDGASGAVTCTVTGSRVAKSINCTGFTGTLAGASTPDLAVSGSVTLVAGMTLTYAGQFQFLATGTFISAGKTISGVRVNGAGATLTLGDALTLASGTSGYVIVVNGTFTTSASNYSVTGSSITGFNNANSKIFNFNASTISLSQASNQLSFPGSNYTIDFGTSQVNLTASNATLSTSGITYYNLSFTGTAVGNRTISGSNTFNNLTITPTATSNLAQIFISANQTVNGTLTCSGATALRRVFLQSEAVGTTRTITAAAISADDCDIRDITISGAAAGSSPTRAGDCGGNSGITFPAAKTVYRVGTNTTWPGSSSWALSSGAGGSDNNFPLAQDTAVIDNATTLTGTLTAGIFNMGSLDCSTRTNAITLSYTSSFNIHGSYSLGSGVTISGTSTQYFYTIGTQSINTAGKTLTFPMFIQASGTLQLGAALNCSGTTGITHYAGTFSAVTYNVTCVVFNTNNTNTRTLNMGSGTWTLTGTGTVWNADVTSNLTFNKDAANIILTNTTTTARSFLVGGLTYNKLTIGGATGTSTLTIGGSALFVTFSELASTKTVAHTISFSSGLTTTVGDWTITGTAGNVVTIQSSSVSSHTLIKTGGGIVSADYLSISRSTATPSNTWYAGANSTNGGSNSGWIFTAPPTAGGNMFFMFS
jgi:hypothetical protein